MFLKGKPLIVWRRSAEGTDEMGEPLISWVPETVENVLYAPTRSARLADSDRPLGTDDTITAHFPKAYKESLANCRLEVFGKLWDVIGDPQGFPEDLCPGQWNRTTTARKVEG